MTAPRRRVCMSSGAAAWIVARCTGPRVRRWAAVLGFAVASGFVTGGAMADDGGMFYGMLRERDLTPFGYLRLDMRPAYAVTIEPGTWALEFNLGYQNTWALSERVEDYLTSLAPSGRRTLGPADWQAIQALPGENYLLDMEGATLDATVHYKFSSNWTAYLIVSAASYQGGFLDSTIESFHRMFGFSTFGRPAVRRNDFNLLYDLRSAQVMQFAPPTDGGLLDPTVGLHYVGWKLPGRWALALEAAAKIPVSGERRMLSTGHFDYGAQATLQWRGIRHAFYGSLSAVDYGGAEWPVPEERRIIPTLVLGYEYRLTASTNLNVQAYVSESVYTRKQTGLSELRGAKYQYSVGFRRRFDRLVFTFGFTENVQNIDNTPDLGFQLGLAYVPHPVAAR